MVLSSPVRARTIIAVAGSAGWVLGHGTERVAAPFVDGAGTPLLLVDRATAERLLEPGRVTAVIGAGRLGTLMVSGWPRELVEDEYAAELASYRADHSACGPTCHGPVALAVELSHVRVTGDHDHEYAPVRVSDYLAATPDAFAVGALPVVDHLNADHGPDLITIAAAVAGTAESAVLGARIVAVDPDALVLVMIDSRGATDLTVPFDRPLSGIDELGPQLHRLLTHPARDRSR